MGVGNLVSIKNFSKMKFNLKKFRFDTVDTDVMDVVEGGYSRVIQDIHNEFTTAGDKLLQNAEQILATTKVHEKDKVDLLSQFGFRSTMEVKSADEITKRIEEQKKISEAVSFYNQEYPLYKFITAEIAEKICKKYNLVLGGVSQYKGFVPAKNLMEIKRFFENHPEDKFYYGKYLSRFGSNSIISKEEYEDGLITPKKFTVREGNLHTGLYETREVDFVFYKSETLLSICAPFKDMDMTGKRLEGVFVKDIPDPIVMLEKLHENGIKGYIIITAWGDEASDESVINHNQN